MVPETVYNFLVDIKADNSKEFFMRNKTKYEIAKHDFERLIDKIIPSVRQFDENLGDLEAKDCAFRIYRDVRFSKDKTPYKTHFGAYIANGGRKSELPGYYLHIEPNGSFAGGGVYMPNPEVLKNLRNEIDFAPDAFLNMINEPEFKTIFPEMYGEKLQKVPKGFDKNSKAVDLLKFKSYTFVHKLDDLALFEPDFEEKTTHIFSKLSVINHFLHRAFL